MPRWRTIGRASTACSMWGVTVSTGKDYISNCTALRNVLCCSYRTCELGAQSIVMASRCSHLLAHDLIPDHSLVSRNGVFRPLAMRRCRL
jgi:hypothetical protein